MVKEEEKVVFIGELDKMRDEYRKCRDLSLRLQIEEDIELLQKAIIISENGSEEYFNRT
ncbi:hypothetical protein [Planococcus salinarum]|uniref:hypothetical protein n=1 Tax=Planococcus salinarum TaxID=622695 RepID=UPI0012B67FF5|nr:hypothetical protein [Planococcus salinarum]